MRSTPTKLYRSSSTVCSIWCAGRDERRERCFRGIVAGELAGTLPVRLTWRVGNRNPVVEHLSVPRDKRNPWGSAQKMKGNLPTPYLFSLVRPDPAIGKVATNSRPRK